MAHYLVRARPRTDTLDELRDRLASGEVEAMRSFGPALDGSLRRARWDPDAEEAVWEEEDYCRPPLREERAAVLEDHFEAIRVEPVEAGQGWERIGELPSLWDALEGLE